MSETTDVLIIGAGAAGMAAAALFGAAKEVYDRVSKKGRPEAMDFLATATGGVAGYLCTYLP